MVYGLVLAIHLFVCVVLIGVILVQGGRGGLSETLAGTAAQSLFGGGAATVLTKITAYCAGVFVVTCLSLAVLSTARGKSVIERMPMVTPDSLPAALPPLAPIPQTPAPSAVQPSAPEPAASALPAAEPRASTPAPTETPPAQQ